MSETPDWAERCLPVIAQLADGAVRSGESLCAELGITRAALWKRIQHLPELGVDFRALKGRGYHLLTPVELLDAGRIDAALAAIGAVPRPRYSLLALTDSTNARARELAHGAAVLAEWQSHGRGRHGRSWHSPFGASVYLSYRWRFERAPAELAGLGIALGIAAAEALVAMGAQGIGIKWPNDLVAGGRKLGGMLIELVGEAYGPCEVVAGIGVNLSLPDRIASSIDQPVTDLARQCPVPPSRNALAAQLLWRWRQALEHYAKEGLSASITRRPAFDVLDGREVVIHQGRRETHGRAAGIEPNGALRLWRDGMIETYAAGEVSVRRRK